jgi:hypothetical protein
MVFLFFLLVIIVSPVWSHAHENDDVEKSNYVLLKININDEDQIPIIQSIVTNLIEVKPNYVKAFTLEKHIVELENIGFKIDVLDLSEVIDQSIFGVLDAGLYHTYDEMVTELSQIESNYPSIAKVFDIGDSIEGRDILAIKISDNPDVDEVDEPDVLYMGATHAREWISVEIPMYLAYHLVINYGVDPNITKFVDEREIWIVPMVNPDGVEYSQQVYQMWRKNKRDNDDDGYFERSYDGVDVNRNYGYMWGYDDYGSSPYPWSETYRGEYAFSEPENQAIRNLALQNDFIFSISYHSYGELIIYPWGYIDADTDDHKLFTDIAEKMAEYNGYTYGNAKDGVIYNTNGDVDDWLYGEMGTLAYTFELATMFIPPESQIDDIWLQNKDASLYLLEIADDPKKIYPSINIYTDKTQYIEGDTMEVGLTLTNPHDAIQVGVYIWVESPEGTKIWVVRKPSVMLPQGLIFDDSTWKTYALPPVQVGEYLWHAAIVDPSTLYILSESISPWTFE